MIARCADDALRWRSNSLCTQILSLGMHVQIEWLTDDWAAHPACLSGADNVETISSNPTRTGHPSHFALRANIGNHSNANMCQMHAWPVALLSISVQFGQVWWERGRECPVPRSGDKLLSSAAGRGLRRRDGHSQRAPSVGQSSPGGMRHIGDGNWPSIKGLREREGRVALRTACMETTSGVERTQVGECDGLAGLLELLCGDLKGE